MKIPKRVEDIDCVIDKVSKESRTEEIIHMGNITKVTEIGLCVGCGSCNVCEHISFINNSSAVPIPIVDDKCINCGACLAECIYDPDYEGED